MSIEQVALLEESLSLAEMVSSSSVASEYRKAKYILEQDKQAQEMISRFADMKEKYEEVQRFGKYHPDFHTVSAQIRMLKRELDFNENIANFKKAEKELEKLLIECSRIIAGSVSEQIKVPTGNPFFDESSCSGGCGSGGSCGCA
ncbi:YlbF family regulator [Fictibacillus phosphorivorans]|uniref:YlbF family regulator n=1 Tax=Fictibacillus phosphorivorans TaxID=1221500 RepID=UPI00204240ED|nr:YlbF family regulator [Fictibacillus phosphorivorans]MCM3717282.1 YlbF family regulator [Fictibacillus phosphorivorans]MCM3774969.1 YlbF family regulator [Fictibacillus phosphorivorans]